MRLIGLAVVLAGSLVLAPLAMEAQQTEKARRIGFLSGPTPAAVNVESFRRSLREHGYVESRNLLVEWRSAEGHDDRLPGLATELARLNVEIIVTEGTAAALAAKNATGATPIVFTFVLDPVAVGLVTSLARPGGNVTGVTNVSLDLTGKRLELLRDAIPSLKSVTLLTDPANPANNLIVNDAQLAARRLGLELRHVEVRHLTELEPTLTTAVQQRTGAVLLVPGAFIFMHRLRIADVAIKHGLPVIGWQSPLAESGALMSYGPNNAEMLGRAAHYVAKILKGAKPADLPVEQPTKFDLVVNLKTAKALGLTIPPSVLGRADHVIE
jgi:putative tryptophan/tyrosine transport system substrate-binding protein